jgi:hypothetical protein
MRHWPKRLFALAAPLLLTGCLWGPGKFNSDLTVRKDGSFILDYRGELVVQLPPDEATGKPWKADMAHCFEGMLNKTSTHVIVTGPNPAAPKDRPCTAAEIAAQKADYERTAADSRKQAEQAAAMFGLPGIDEDSGRAFATKLMKYAGWRSVTYRGKGVFDVDYHFEGRATQDFLFPVLPDNNLIVPFVAIRRRADGLALVTAPAFTGGAGPMGAAAAGAGDVANATPLSRAQGRFTIVTDGEILTNNSEDGAAPHAIGRQLHWDVDQGSKKIPETLIRLH